MDSGFVLQNQPHFRASALLCTSPFLLYITTLFLADLSLFSLGHFLSFNDENFILPSATANQSSVPLYGVYSKIWVQFVANQNCVFHWLTFMLLQYDWWDREQTQICMVYNRDLIVWKLLGGPGWICCTKLKESRKLKWDKNRSEDKLLNIHNFSTVMIIFSSLYFNFSGDPAGHHVIIVDDLVMTGGTLVQCAKVRIWF